MKKFKLVCGIFAIAGLGLTSCSDDDSNNVNDDAQIAGTYELEEVNTQEATDLDGDGTPHFDQDEETDCYDDARIILNADNTFTYYNEYFLVDEESGAGTCASATYTGTWEIFAEAGSTIQIDATYTDGNGEEVEISLTKVGGTLTRYELFGSYPNNNGAGGFETVSGDVEYVFEKD